MENVRINPDHILVVITANVLPSNHSAHTCTADDVDGNPDFFQSPNYADVSKTSGYASAKNQTDRFPNYGTSKSCIVAVVMTANMMM